MMKAACFNEEEWLALMEQSAELLAIAYQETLYQDMWLVSEKLKAASLALSYTIAKNNNAMIYH